MMFEDLHIYSIFWKLYANQSEAGSEYVEEFKTRQMKDTSNTWIGHLMGLDAEVPARKALTKALDPSQRKHGQPKSTTHHNGSTSYGATCEVSTQPVCSCFLLCWFSNNFYNFIKFKTDNSYPINATLFYLQPGHAPPQMQPASAPACWSGSWGILAGW